MLYHLERQTTTIWEPRCTFSHLYLNQIQDFIQKCTPNILTLITPDQKVRQSVVTTSLLCKHILDKSMWLQEFQTAVAHQGTGCGSCVAIDVLDVQRLELTLVKRHVTTHTLARGKTTNKEQLSNYLFCNAYKPVVAQQVLPKDKNLTQLRISWTDLKMVQAIFAKVF